MSAILWVCLSLFQALALLLSILQRTRCINLVVSRLACLVLQVILGSQGFHLSTHLFLSLALLQRSLRVTQCMFLTV